MTYFIMLPVLKLATYLSHFGICMSVPLSGSQTFESEALLVVTLYFKASAGDIYIPRTFL